MRRGAHSELMAGARYEGAAGTAPGFALFRVGAYPAMARSARGHVRGELYAVNDDLLERLDEFEGCPDLYERAKIELSDGSEAFAYVMDPTRVQGLPPMDGGSWLGDG